jgi:hypothetical protein
VRQSWRGGSGAIVTWLRIDDQISFHAKTVAAGNAAFGAWVRMGAWACAQLQDGKVPTGVALTMATPEDLERLTSVRFLDAIGGGYQIHDFLEFNPSRATVLAERDAKRAGGLRGAASRWHGISHGTTHTPCHASANAPVPVPIPSRPDLKRESSAPRKRSRAKSSELNVSPETNALRDHYVEAYVSAHNGAKPAFKSWSRAVGALKDLRDLAGDIETAKRIITNAMADPWTAKNRCQPWEILSDSNKHRTAPTTAARNSRLAGGQPVDPNAPWMQDGAA